MAPGVLEAWEGDRGGTGRWDPGRGLGVGCRALWLWNWGPVPA